MNASRDETANRLLEALHQRWMSLGEYAWLVLGLLLLAGIVSLLWILRWIMRGGLSRPTSWGEFHRRRAVDRSSSEDSC